jgi:hypothetical protein
VRWIEISIVLGRESKNGKNAVAQIEFKGEGLDLSPGRRREKVLMSRRGVRKMAP